MVLARKKVLFLSVSKYKRSKKNIGVKKAKVIRESEMPKNWECPSREVVQWRAREADLIRKFPAHSALY